MKKSYALTIKLMVVFGLGLPQVQASVIEEFVSKQVKQLNTAQTHEARYEIATKPINWDYLRSLKCFQDLNDSKLYLHTDVEDKENLNAYKTNMLMLAISVGNPDAVAQCLSVVNDINDLYLTAYGYRQEYTPAHMALDPQFPKIEAPLANRLKIIDLLGEKGANFNTIPSLDIYKNPPLAAGRPSGRILKEIDQLRARALLYGADPQVDGSSFHGLKLQYENTLSKFALDYYIERTKENVQLRPTELVLSHLRKMAQDTTHPELHLLFPIPSAPKPIVINEKSGQPQSPRIVAQAPLITVLTADTPLLSLTPASIVVNETSDELQLPSISAQNPLTSFSTNTLLPSPALPESDPIFVDEKSSKSGSPTALSRQTEIKEMNTTEGNLREVPPIESNTERQVSQLLNQRETEVIMTPTVQPPVYPNTLQPMQPTSVTEKNWPSLKCPLL